MNDTNQVNQPFDCLYLNSQRYTPEFKNETVRQIIERGNSVSEVSGRFGVSSETGILCMQLAILI